MYADTSHVIASTQFQPTHEGTRNSEVGGLATENPVATGTISKLERGIFMQNADLGQRIDTANEVIDFLQDRLKVKRNLSMYTESDQRSFNDLGAINSLE